MRQTWASAPRPQSPHPQPKNTEIVSFRLISSHPACHKAMRSGLLAAASACGHATEVTAV